MSKAHRGTTLKQEQPKSGRGTDPISKRSGVKLLYEVEIDGQKMMVSKQTKAKLQNAKRLADKQAKSKAAAEAPTPKPAPVPAAEAPAVEEAAAETPAAEAPAPEEAAAPPAVEAPAAEEQAAEEAAEAPAEEPAPQTAAETEEKPAE